MIDSIMEVDGLGAGPRRYRTGVVFRKAASGVRAEAVLERAESGRGAPEYRVGLKVSLPLGGRPLTAAPRRPAR